MTYNKLITPSGIIYGSEAMDAIDQGVALPLAGASAAFTGAKIIYRNGDKPRYVTTEQLQASNDADIIEQLKHIAAKRPHFAGLDLSKPHIMGILNLTPDSFSDGGMQDDLLKLEQQVDEYIHQGVSILDIGGESTRPNAQYVNCAQEIDRIKPVFAMLKTKNVLISIDSRKAKVMDFALNAGANIINDVAALEFRANVKSYGEDSGDAEQVALLHKCPVIIMHSQGTPETMQDNPQYENILFEIYDYLALRIAHLTKLGLQKSDIMIDVGIGFGKSADHCLIILHHLSLFHSLGAGQLVGASRKSFIGQVDGQMDASKRLGGSLATAQIAQNAGVQLHRMHDVEAALQQLKIINSIQNI